MNRHGVARTLLAIGAALLFTGCAHLVVLHDPLTANEHNDLGVVYESNGQRLLAGREYRKALRADPHHPLARVNLGNVEAASHHWSEAETEYRRALADSAGNLDAMNNLAIVLVRQRRRLGEAQGLAERAVAAAGPRDSTYRATLVEVRAARRP